MGWKATGQPTVRKQRDKWVVRLDGIDTETGRHRPRQLGTYTSQQAARTAAAEFAAERAEGGASGTVGWLVDQWVASKTDITEKSQMQNRWAAGHIRKALGAIRLDQLDRSDIARWYDELAAGGVLNKRSITIIRRVLRAALEDALDEATAHLDGPTERAVLEGIAQWRSRRTTIHIAHRRAAGLSCDLIIRLDPDLPGGCEVERSPQGR